MSQQQQILEYLSDGEWHCMTTANFYMKDDRKRISELREQGHVILSQPCDGRCGVKHNSRLLMRKLYGNKKELQPRDFSLPRNNGKEIWQTEGYGDTGIQPRQEIQPSKAEVMQTLW